MNYFNDMVTISRMRALALSHEASMYEQASRHEEAKDVLYPDYPFIYRWSNNEKRKDLYDRKLRVLVRSKSNSALVEFEDGQTEVISRNALRKAK